MEIIINSKKYGQHVIYFDDADAGLVMQYKWHLHRAKSRFYARSNTYDSLTKKGVCKYMHRLILNAQDGIEIDHIDNNGLNNFRNNIRTCTHKQNNQNKGAPKRNKTGYKGVHLFKRDGNYQAYITVNNKRIHGGYFDKIEDAAKRYNELALKYHGEFAFLNKIPNE